jgi:nitrogen regulatory protein P-II 1
MKMIIAILRADKLQQTKQALEDIGLTGLTVSDVRGHGRQKGHTEFYRGAEHQVDLLPKVQFEIVTSDERVDQIVKTIVASAQTGKIGDGKIFILPVEQAIRVRTGESGENVA